MPFLALAKMARQYLGQALVLGESELPAQEPRDCLQWVCLLLERVKVRQAMQKTDSSEILHRENRASWEVGQTNGIEMNRTHCKCDLLVTKMLQLGLIEPLFGPEDAIISDSLNHASLIDGIRLCKAKRYRYQNSDMDDS